MVSLNFRSYSPPLRKKARYLASPVYFYLLPSVPARPLDAGYEIEKISRELDYIVLMAYDFYGAWDATTGHVSPLLPPANATGDCLTNNVEFAANYWVRSGCPKEKLYIGLGTYGRSFTLADPKDTGRGALTKGAGKAGTYTREAGFLSYYEVCEMLQAGGTRYFLNDQQVPYLVLGDQWVGYEDKESIAKKVQFIKAQGFAGAMVWDYDLDDFGNRFCGEGNYPLIQLIKDNLN